jgi:hypothetical protein
MIFLCSSFILPKVLGFQRVCRCSGALKVMEREGNILSRVLRDCWDCRSRLESMTKTNKSKATNAIVSITGHITSDELLRCLDRTEMANGFANRFLFACVRRSRLLSRGSSIPDADIIEMAGNIHAALAAARSLTATSAIL